MKATMDIPDELYRQVKAKSALRGQAVREVAVSLFQGWLATADDAPPVAPSLTDGHPPPAWFGAARQYARRVRRHDMSAVRRSIARGRARAGGAGAGKGEGG
jgi:hypothetical protein